MHVDLSQDDFVAIAFDAQLLQIGADDGERSDLRDAGECCPKLAHGGSFILRVEFAVEEKSGQEFGLVAGWIEVQSSPFHNRVDNSLTAVADERDGVLAAAFQGEDQRCRGDRDDDAERGRQCNVYGDAAQMPR